MYQLIKLALSIGCGLGGQYVAPFIVPFVNPVMWSCLLSIFLCIFLGSKTILSTSDGTEKEAGRSFTSAFFIYYVLSVSFLLLMYNSICDVNNALPI